MAEAAAADDGNTNSKLYSINAWYIATPLS
jgi:hypothetical protein